MKTLTRNFSKLLLAGGVIFLSSCDKDNDTTNNTNNKDATVKQVLESEARYSSMNEAVEESNQGEFFSKSSANITLFAANNDAFNELYAQMNVSSMSELKTKMGDEAFADLVLYHALNGRFDVSELEDGNWETNAANDDNHNLTVYVESQGNGSVMLNGNDDNGAMTSGSATIGATNGTVIEIDGVIMAQTNLENLEDSEEENESTLFMTILANADAGTRTMLSDESDQNTVLVGNDAEVEAIFKAYFRTIIDEDDLNNLLDANQKASLFAAYNVTTMADLITKISVGDLIALNNITMADIMAELDADDNSEIISTMMFAGDINLDDEAANNGTVTTEAGITFNVSYTAQNKIELTDSNTNELLLDGKSAQSVNGSVYTIASVQEQP